MQKAAPGEGRLFYRLRRTAGNDDGVPADDPDEPVAIPITGELDLHTFRPSEIAALLDDYLAECRRRGILRVRVIHGKGTGTLRTMVQARLRQMPGVAGFATGDETSGGWGATIVTLKPDNSC